MKIGKNEKASQNQTCDSHTNYIPQSFPGGSDGKELTCNAGDPDSVPGLERSPGEETLPTPAFLLGESRGQRRLEGYSLEGCKEWDMTEWLTLYATEFQMFQENQCFWV